MTNLSTAQIREAPHRHAHGAATIRALWIALALTAGFAVVEAVGGWLAGSLALISDAGHMVTDAASFVVALIATAVARRPPSQRASYGYARAEVLAAFVNAFAMLALIVWIAVEAVRRLLARNRFRGPSSWQSPQAPRHQRHRRVPAHALRRRHQRAARCSTSSAISWGLLQRWWQVP
jgi:cobalt-zinc-cadmium efflux system protein